MEIKKISMPIEQAQKEWKNYNVLLKTRKEKYLVNMKKAMFELKKGNELIDIYSVFEKVGLDKFGRPRLAIARADWTNCFFRKKDTGRGFFLDDSSTWYTKSDGAVSFPPNTFMNWIRDKNDDGTDSTWSINEDSLKTKVPIIPTHLHPENNLKDYYILWEVDDWEAQIPKKDDPLLLKRITENLFVLLGAWDVTDLEQSIIKGL